MGPPPEEARHRLPEVLSLWSPTGTLNSSSSALWQHAQMLPTREAHQTQCLEFPLGLVTRASLNGYQLSRCPEESRCSAWTTEVSVSTASHSYQLGNEENLPESQVPRGQPWTMYANRPLMRAVSSLCQLLSPYPYLNMKHSKDIWRAVIQNMLGNIFRCSASQNALLHNSESLKNALNFSCHEIMMVENFIIMLFYVSGTAYVSGAVWILYRDSHLSPTKISMLLTPILQISKTVTQRE